MERSLFMLLASHSAIRQLMLEMEEAPHEICEILNLIVDSYCFRAKDIKEMDFFRLRLERLMTTANNRLRNMERLLGSCWWEEVVGVGWWFQFNKSIAKAFIRLYAKLLKDLQAMKFATELETSHWTHLIIMKKLQKRIYVLQVTTNDLLEDISSEIVRGSRRTCLSIACKRDSTCINSLCLVQKCRRTSSITLNANSVSSWQSTRRSTLICSLRKCTLQRTWARPCR